MSQPKSFQVLSRNNDVNGNPYRLLLVYDDEGTVIEAYEARSSSPNVRGALAKRGLRELWTFHLSPAEYNSTRKMAKPERAD